MPLLSCYVTDDTMKRLQAYADWRGDGRTPEQLAEAAVEEAGLDCEKWLPKEKRTVAKPLELPPGTTVAPKPIKDFS